MNNLKKYVTYIEQAENINTEDIWNEYDETLRHLKYEEIMCLFEDLEHTLIQLLLNPNDTNLDELELKVVAEKIKNIASYQESFTKIAFLKKIYEKKR